MKQAIKKIGRPLKKNNGLSADLIVNTAKCLMLAIGKIPSMRTVAAELNVDPMALYRYFRSKDLLLEAIATSLMFDMYKPKGSMNWQQELTKLAKSYLTILHRYEGLLETLLSMKSNSPAHVFIDRFYYVIEPLQLNGENKKAFLDLLVDYLHGFSFALAHNTTEDLSLEYIDKPLHLLFQVIKIKSDSEKL